MDLFFEKAKDVVSFHDNITREELINILIQDKSLISYAFEYLTDDEKKEYYPYTFFSIIKIYLEDLSFDEMLKVLIRKIDLIDDYRLYNICIELVNNQNLEKFLDIFSLQLNEHYITKIIKKIENEELKIKFIDKYLVKPQYVLDAVLCLSDDYKEQYLNKIDKMINKVKIILSFEDKNRIKKYANSDAYFDYRYKLIVATNDREFIIKWLEKSDASEYKIKLINEVESDTLKFELIEMLDDANIKSFMLSNKCEVEERLTRLYGTPVDSKITIGVELECSNKEIDKYIEINNIFNDYRIKGDNSVKNGFEIVSPILKYDINDLNILKNVCDLLENNGFYTDQTAGGHIHIGASYLNKIEDYYMLLYLYINTEDILYFISDRENSVKRNSISKYACKNKQGYMEAIDIGIFKRENKDIKNMFDEINNDRYKGLNFKNLNSYWKNTIEFRMPNGEINFEELLLNIKLFARLVEMSHKLSELDNISEIKVMAQKLGKCEKEKDRLELLLNILFDNEEERQKYRDRYFANKRLNLLKFKNLLSELKTVLKAEELVEIDDNNHLKRSKIESVNKFV